jgi:hypothetical protein
MAEALLSPTAMQNDRWMPPEATPRACLRSADRRFPHDPLGPPVRTRDRLGLTDREHRPPPPRAHMRPRIMTPHSAILAAPSTRRTVDLCAQDSGRSMAPAARMERSATLAESMHSLDRAADRVALSAIGGTWHRVRIGGSDDTGFRLSFVGKWRNHQGQTTVLLT